VLSKFISAFLGHAFVALLYGGAISLYFQDLGFGKTLSFIVQIIIIAYTIYEAYKEELKSFYPFAKAILVNILGLVLLVFVFATELYELMFIAYAVVIFSIKYRCKKCIVYKRYPIE
jgi:hypothetical protein